MTKLVAFLEEAIQDLMKKKPGAIRSIQTVDCLCDKHDKEIVIGMYNGDVYSLELKKLSVTENPNLKRDINDS